MELDGAVVETTGEARLLLTSMILVNASSAVLVFMLTAVSDVTAYRTLATVVVVGLILAGMASEVGASRIVHRIGRDKAGWLPFQFLRPRYLRQAVRVLSPDSGGHWGVAFFLFPLGVIASLLLIALTS